MIPVGGNNNPYAGNNITIGSQVNPTGVYTPQATQTAMNQAIAAGQQTAYGTPHSGMMGILGNSPTLASQNAYNAANAVAQGRANAESIRLGDRAANLQNILAGQVGRGTDILGQLGNLGNLNQMNQDYTNQMQNMQLGAFQNLLGGFGGGNSFQNFLDALYWQ